jgi:hypothetical protein
MASKHVRDWPEIFAGDEILTTAIRDRLLHRRMLRDPRPFRILTDHGEELE